VTPHKDHLCLFQIAGRVFFSGLSFVEPQRHVMFLLEQEQRHPIYCNLGATPIYRTLFFYLFDGLVNRMQHFIDVTELKKKTFVSSLSFNDKINL
jgi:hypothetical protein